MAAALKSSSCRGRAPHDDAQLAVIDVADAAKVEPETPLGSDRPLTPQQLHGVVDHHVGSRGRQTLERRPGHFLRSFAASSTFLPAFSMGPLPITLS